MAEFEQKYAKSNVNNTGVGSYHLADNPNLYEPSRNHAFKFVLNEKLNTLLAANVNAEKPNDYDYLTDICETITLSVDEASVPHFELEVLSIKRGNSVVKYAGAPTWSEGSLKLNDFVGARTKDKLMAWNALAYDAGADVVHLGENYKHDCTLIEYTGDFSRVIRSWTLKGCWLRSITEADFSHADNGLRTINATIVFDRAIPVIERVISEE